MGHLFNDLHNSGQTLYEALEIRQSVCLIDLYELVISVAEPIIFILCMDLCECVVLGLLSC